MAEEKDDYRVQQARLKRLAQELNPGCEVRFSPKENSIFVEMRVNDPKTGKILYSAPDYWRYGQIADKDDGELREFLRSWALVANLHPDSN
jgi:hypothetical protein